MFFKFEFTSIFPFLADADGGDGQRADGGAVQGAEGLPDASQPDAPG